MAVMLESRNIPNWPTVLPFQKEKTPEKRHLYSRHLRSRHLHSRHPHSRHLHLHQQPQVQQFLPRQSRTRPACLRAACCRGWSWGWRRCCHPAAPAPGWRCGRSCCAAHTGRWAEPDPAPCSRPSSPGATLSHRSGSPAHTPASPLIPVGASLTSDPRQCQTHFWPLSVPASPLTPCQCQPHLWPLSVPASPLTPCRCQPHLWPPVGASLDSDPCRCQPHLWPPSVPASCLTLIGFKSPLSPWYNHHGWLGAKKEHNFLSFLIPFVKMKLSDWSSFAYQ